ncbi:MAG: protein kinase [Cyanobacteria bacterium P01_G01_bin.67]
MIGATLNGRYRILHLLGTGRCGQTYLAQDLQANQAEHFVIKQFEPEAKDALSLRKAKYLFAREVKILQILGKSDRIPKLVAYFRQGEKFYLVHEYVVGTDLTQELGDRTWAAIEVLGLIKEILEIVEVAHREQVIHQDIKPSNIIRRQSDGKLMLIDFGSVKRINNQMANSEGNTSLTMPIGTLGYMPPEQKSIKPKLASDIYAVGMIGIYALTGVKPQNIALDHDTEAVQWHNLIQVEPKLIQVIERMVSPDLNQRYASASEALKIVRNLTLGKKLLDIKTIISAGALLLMIVGAGYYYWRLETSLSKTSEVEMFAQDRTQFPFLYRNEEHGLSMKYPSSWQLTQLQQDRGTIAQLTPQVQQSSVVTPEVSIEIEQSNTESLEQYTTNAVYQITQLPQSKIIDSRPTSLAGVNGHKVIYTSLSSEQDLSQKYLQLWTLRGDRVYKVTYQATMDDYSKFASIVEQEMIPSIKINPQ